MRPHVALFLAMLGPAGLFSPAGVSPGFSAQVENPPFDPGLERLAEILGSLQFLSRLCNGNDAGWRVDMERLLAAEKPAAERRKRFVAAFNRGYDGFSSNYRNCTPSAMEAIALFKKEGSELSRDLAGKFGN